MTVLSCWIQRYGIPSALYGDHKNVLVSNREPTVEEQLAGIEPKSYFEKACEKLGIQVIAANIPQAKGRVERNHAVCRDRFVKELHPAGISAIEDANRFLEQTYLPAINEKFARPAHNHEDAPVPVRMIGWWGGCVRRAHRTSTFKTKSSWSGRYLKHKKRGRLSL